MARQKTYILKVKDGKQTREFELNKREYDEFLLRYEENELVDYSCDVSDIKINLVSPPPFTKK